MLDFPTHTEDKSDLDRYYEMEFKIGSETRDARTLEFDDESEADPKDDNKFSFIRLLQKLLRFTN
jgi:hypothetical protein